MCLLCNRGFWAIFIFCALVEHIRTFGLGILAGLGFFVYAEIHPCLFFLCYSFCFDQFSAHVRGVIRLIISHSVDHFHLIVNDVVAARDAAERRGAK